MIQLRQGASCSALLQIRNQIVSVLFLLKTTESHLRSWNVFLGVLKIHEEGVIRPARLASESNRIKHIPCNALLLVCVSVLESFYLTGLSSEQSVQATISLIVL